MIRMAERDIKKHIKPSNQVENSKRNSIHERVGRALSSLWLSSMCECGWMRWMCLHACLRLYSCLCAGIVYVCMRVCECVLEQLNRAVMSPVRNSVPVSICRRARLNT